MPFPSFTASQLRRNLNARAEAYARTHGLVHDFCPGPSPTVLFGPAEAAPGQPASRGNFHPAAYARIAAHPEWLRRLAKPHTASRRSCARHDWHWKELDSACSSDALLMNIFCHPQVFDGALLAAPVAALLDVDRNAQPCFGARPGFPLRAPLKPRSKSSAPRPAVDRTEVDLTLTSPSGTLFLEAKLTESDFQNAPLRLIERYRDLDSVFDVARLPQKLDRIPRTFLIQPPLRISHFPGAPSACTADGWEPTHVPDPDFPDDSFRNLPTRKAEPRIQGYQLIRNVLAAYAAGASFSVLCDARRHDLIETWFAVISAVRAPDLTHRLKIITWQELARALPPTLQRFLDEKYGTGP